MHKTILITAGGTGGHVFPALALSQTFDKSYNIIWVGGAAGIEHEIVPKHNIKLEKINIVGLRKKGFIKAILLPFVLIRAFFQAFTIILRYRPDAIVGFGGYATFPLCIMGRFLRVPVLIHEQNAIPGLTNRVLAKIADVVMVAFPRVLVSNRTKLVGNPVREAIVSLPSSESRYTNPFGKLRILVMGGSLGAKILNETMPEVCTKINMPFDIVHQVGRGDATLVKASYDKLKIKAQVVNFIEDMAEAYSTADLIICRSGASTVSEVCVAGVAAIFVPYPHAVDDHQRYNAQWLADAGGAKMLLQKNLNPESLSRLINSLGYNDCLKMAKIAHSFAIIDSAMRIHDIVNEKVR